MHNLVEPSLQPKINELFEVTLRGDADSGVCGGGSEGREGLNRPLLTVISRGDGGSRGLDCSCHFMYFALYLFIVFKTFASLQGTISS